MSSNTPPESKTRGSFSSQRVFILAAVGSAVGLGNIWRFPYVAYENGGGAFLIPYLVALVTAGLPFLLLDYALGHRNRASAPLAFARISKKLQVFGWWQVAICFMIAVYYAAVVAWAVRFTGFSINQAWGADPESFFFNDFLQAGDPGLTAQFVPGVLVPLAIVWAVVLLVLVLGVKRGIGLLSVIFIPVLILAFAALVVQALLLPGASVGLNAFFEPNWTVLADPSVWAAAYGQIFFSLSVGFGIMITYSSYVGRSTNMTGSGLVVGLANSSFELLAGIGVFSALGFMAQASGVDVSEVATDGLGLAFIAFPAIISEAPAGALLVLLFFGSLVVAGLTSLVSVIEVVISAVRDKFELSRIAATLAVVLPSALISLIFFSTTSGVYVLDIVDHFINQFGILFVAVASTIAVAWAARALPELADHMNHTGSLRLGRAWYVFIGGITPLVLSFVLITQLITDITTPYEGYPTWMLLTLGWGVAVAVIVVAVLASLVRWRPGTSLSVPRESDEIEPTQLAKESLR